METSGPEDKKKKKKKAHRVIFMRHGESEWNRYSTLPSLMSLSHPLVQAPFDCDLCGSTESICGSSAPHVAMIRSFTIPLAT